jgi:hypothetical protein
MTLKQLTKNPSAKWPLAKYFKAHRHVWAAPKSIWGWWLMKLMQQSASTENRSVLSNSRLDDHFVDTLANCHLAHWLLADCHSVYKNTSTLFHHIQQVNKFKNTAIFKKNRVKKVFSKTLVKFFSLTLRDSRSNWFTTLHFIRNLRISPIS